MNIVDDIKNSFKQGSALTRLIYVNAGVFLLVKVLQALFYLIAKPFPLVFWLALPSNPAELLLRPWTLFTYMFLHEGFMHFLFNILGLYWFGRLLLGYFDERKLISLYLIGGLIGGIFYVLVYNLFPVFMGANSILLGASASVIAILVAVAAYAPNQEIQLVLIGRVQMKYVALVYVLLSVIGISSTNAGGNIAHLGGAFWGWLFTSQLAKGKDLSNGFMSFFDKIVKLFKPKQKIFVSHKQPPRNDREYNKQKNQNQKEINRILEKISKTGYDSLNSKEKEILFKQGKK